MQIPGSPQREISRVDFTKAEQSPGLKVVKPNFSFCCVSHEPEPITQPGQDLQGIEQEPSPSGRMVNVNRNRIIPMNRVGHLERERVGPGR